MPKGLPYLPNAPKFDPTLEIYGPAVEGLPKVPNPDELFLDRSNRFQKSWFNNYNKLNKHAQVKIKGVLLKKLRKKNTNWTMKGVNSFLNNSRKRAEVVEGTERSASSSTTTLNTRANLRKMRNTEAEREGMERQRREMERQRQEMERRQQAQRNSDINQLEQAFMTLTLPTNSKFNITEDQLKDLERKLQNGTLTNNEFNQVFVKEQLLSLLGKLERGNENLTPEERSYIQEVIKSSKHKGSLFTKIKNKFTRSGGGLTKKKSTTHKRKLNTRKRTSITNKKKLNTRKRKYITNKKKLNIRKRKSNTHKRK